MNQVLVSRKSDSTFNSLVFAIAIGLFGFILFLINGKFFGKWYVGAPGLLLMIVSVIMILTWIWNKFFVSTKVLLVYEDNQFIYRDEDNNTYAFKNSNIKNVKFEKEVKFTNGKYEFTEFGTITIFLTDYEKLEKIEIKEITEPEISVEKIKSYI